MYVLFSAISRKNAGLAHEIDLEFMSGMDEDEILTLRDENAHSRELRVLPVDVHHPQGWIGRKPFRRARLTIWDRIIESSGDVEFVAESDLPARTDDFRDHLEDPEDQLTFEFVQGEFVIRSCTAEVVRRLQELIGDLICKIVETGKELYDVFIPEVSPTVLQGLHV